jgi:hypothetical protein
MLVIRKEQMKVLSEYVRNSFEKSAVDYVEKKHPEKFAEMGESYTRTLVRFGIGKASKYDIHAQEDILRFISLMVTIDQGFDDLDEMSWAREILDEEAFDGSEKMELICQQLQDDVETGTSSADGSDMRTE